MNDSELDHLLEEIASEPPPTLPAGFESRVWRKIRGRTTPLARWDDLLSALLRPRLLFGSVACALVIGILAGVLPTSGNKLASGAMHLQIFASDAPGFPSTLLARKL